MNPGISKKSSMVTGFSRRLIRIKMLFRVFTLARSRYGTIRLAIITMLRIIQKRRKIHGNKFVLKYVHANERYFSALNVPGWPSEAFDTFISNEFIKADATEGSFNKLHTAIFSITSRCNLRCEHCYEWNNISSKDILSIQELKIVQQKLHEQGICHMQYSGGEPLSRMDALLELLAHRKDDVDYWILTSGYGMKAGIAQKLNNAGLTGAVISLDHWIEKSHNAFRKHPRSFFWVREAVRNCRNANLVTGLSICATKAFITETNLWKYADLAKSWGVGFIRILEPRQVGFYTGKDVLLNPDHEKILEKFFLEINSRKKHRQYPVVMYPGYHQRQVGCLGAGNRYIYIDSKGDIHACPFCQNHKGNALKNSLENSIGLIKEAGCHRFKTNPVE